RLETGAEKACSRAERRSPPETSPPSPSSSPPRAPDPPPGDPSSSHAGQHAKQPATRRALTNADHVQKINSLVGSRAAFNGSLRFFNERRSSAPVGTDAGTAPGSGPKNHSRAGGGRKAQRHRPGQ